MSFRTQPSQLHLSRSRPTSHTARAMAESESNSAIRAVVDDLGKDFIPSQEKCNILDQQVVGYAYLQKLQSAFQSFSQRQFEGCVNQCGTLVDITWEHLNTGHWKDVNITWRHAYTLLSWLKAVSQFAMVTLKKDGAENLEAGALIQESVKTCDMGLLMGAPIEDNILTKLVARLQKAHTKSLLKSEPQSSTCIDSSDESETPTKKPKIMNLPLMKPEHAIPIHEQPSLEYFREHFMLPQHPVLITGSMDYWPAMNDKRWSLDYIRTTAGCRTVPIEIGSKYTEDAWSQALITIDEFIRKYIENAEPTHGKGYLAQHQLFDQIPELRRDIHVPSYCGLGESDEVDINAWFGPEGTISPMHQDPKHNFLCQVVGEKYVRLYSTEHSALVYPHEDTLFSNTSQVDVENPDLEKFPEFPKAPYLECVLREGQMLYIPPKCWHYVRSLAVSFSVSFWWE